MRKTIRLLSWCLVLVLAATPALAGPGNANFLLGNRQIDTGKEDAQDIEDQPVFGASVDFKTGILPFSWFLGAYASAKEEDVDLGSGGRATVTAALAEVSFGVGKVWKLAVVRPFVHGGVAATALKIEFDVDGGGSEDISDNSGAVYGEGGVYWRLGDSFNIGVAGRLLLGTDYDFEGESIEADYAQGGLILGWGWD